MPNRKREKLDVTRGGRFVNNPPVPESFYESDAAMQYWDKMNRFVDYVDETLPPGFRFVNTSAFRKGKVRDAEGNVVSTGRSHTQGPAHDFVIVPEDPSMKMSEDELWSMYQNVLQPLAQNFGIRADGRQFVGGKKHGTAPHLHLQSGRTGYGSIGDEEDLLARTDALLKTLERPVEVAQYKRGGKIRDAYRTSLI